MSEESENQMLRCSECGCPIFRDSGEDGLYEGSCGCRTELLREDEDLPEAWT